MILPKSVKYAPAMACRVYDKIFTGLDGALLGTFNIPIGEIMYEKRKWRLKILLEIDCIIEDLKKITANA